jgi:glycosyltransferase involved in cell wall biosynthesis
MEKVKPLIMMVCDYYLPGFESGGAMRTLVNMVDRLSDEFNFKIITRDHDGPLNREPYREVVINAWNRVGEADVYYLSSSSVRMNRIKELIREVGPDILYLNSFFSPLTVFTLLLRRFGAIDRMPMVLAPEGELVTGALSIKPLKKELYIRAAKLLTLFTNTIWKAASEYEKDAIETIFGKHNKVFVAPNMPPRTIMDDFDVHQKPEKRPGMAKMVFLSRFMRKKNFNWLLDNIRHVTGELSIDVYGPIEDAAYWEECQEIIKTLPENINVQAKGTVSHENVATTLASYHFFILPTLGENFGHIFVEALAAGCPLVISDRSPWRGLEPEGIGWDIPLENVERWLDVLNDCIEMENENYRTMSQNAREYAVAWLADPAHERSNREILEFALAAYGKAPLKT